MGADLSTERSDGKSEQISPSQMGKLKEMYERNPLNTQPDKKQFMSLLNAGKRETDIIFDYFDMDGNGQIDSYEFICAIAMLVHSSIDLKAEFLFKLYDFDNNNFITRDELVHLIKTYMLASKKQLNNNEVEKRTDEFMKNADLDLDKKISLREFQTYLSKSKEILSIFDNYSMLLTNNPMPGTVSPTKKNQTNNMDENETDNIDMNENVQFNEDGDYDNADEMDPDLFAELNKDKIAENMTEEQHKFKEGAEFITKVNEGMFKEELEMQATEFSACKPWMGVVLHSIPSDYQPSPSDNNAPDAHLELEFVHGYRCHDTRNNLRYTNTGDIVYHSAAVGIVLNKTSRTQRFFFDHIDDITAIAIHPDKNLIATGEIGPYPLIAIWDSETMECKVRINGPLQKGINHLAFSKDGKYLVATAADDEHNVAIFDWVKGTTAQITNEKSAKKRAAASVSHVIASGKGPRANVLGACFNNTGDTVALMCIKEVDIVTFAGGQYKIKRATGLRGDTMTTILCGAYIGNTLVTGAYNGSLLLFSGSSFTKSVKAHASVVNCIYPRQGGTAGFITGGNDGMILVWDSKFNTTLKLSIADPSINSLNPKVRSICEDGNGNYLVGTRGGEIIEFEGETPNVISRGHFDMELWGLAPHPKKDKYYTAGQDKMIALWDIQSKNIEKFTTMKQPAEVLTISPDGKHLAIGCKNGELYIFDGMTLAQKVVKKDRKDPISEIKYSPNGQYLAVGCVDFLIFIYDVNKNYTLTKKLKGHVSRVTHMDFSEDSDIIQSNSTSYDLLYHSVSGGKQLPGGASAFKDEKWNTWSCVIGWPVQGIWPPCASGDDINACDRDKDKNVIATGDDFGKVKLFKYPCPVERSSFNKYVGHSSHVTCVRFSSSNNYLISTGGNDKSIFQWRYIHDHEAEGEAEQLENLDAEENNPDDDEGLMNFKEEEMGGTEFGASKPFLGEVKASTPKGFVPAKNAAEPPKEGMKLKYVHGYRAFDTRNNVKYSSDGKIIYHTAALGIVLDKDNNTQTFFENHDEDMVAIALHPNGKIVATGQMAKAGKAKLIDIYVWESDTKKVLANIKGFHLRAIRVLAFSPDGSKLLSGGQDDDNSIAIYDWANNKLVASSPVDKARVLEGQFKNDTEFITVGLKHIKFWNFQGRNLTSLKGVFGSVTSESLLALCVAFDNKTTVTGDAKGNVIVWMGRNATKSVKAHNGAVWTLFSKNNLLYSGGQDGIIKIYTNKFEVKESIDFSKITPFNPGVRSIDMDTANNMLVGTKGGDIVELVNKKPKILMQSHYDNELWGLTINPMNPYQVASGGGDMTLRIWDIKTNRMVKHIILDQDFRALDWTQDGKYIVCGSMSGKIYCISVESMEILGTFQSIFKTEKQWIQELKISPDCKYVAYGAHGGVSKVEILTLAPTSSKVLSQFSIINPRFTSALTHLDWSADSSFIVCNSLAFELKFLNVNAKALVSASASVGIDWNTWTCLFGFPVQGIWPPESTGYIVNYTCMSNNKKVIATGDDFSLVKLFKFPCVVEKARYKEFKGHSSHVPKIRFSVNDLYLISVGGNDKSVFIWETDFGTPWDGEEPEEEYKNDDDIVDDENNNDDYEKDYEDEEEEPPKKSNAKPSNNVKTSNIPPTKKNKVEDEYNEDEDIEEPPKKTNPKPVTNNKIAIPEKGKGNVVAKKKVEENNYDEENYEEEPQPKKSVKPVINNNKKVVPNKTGANNKATAKKSVEVEDNFEEEY